MISRVDMCQWFVNDKFKRWDDYNVDLLVYELDCILRSCCNDSEPRLIFSVIRGVSKFFKVNRKDYCHAIKTEWFNTFLVKWLIAEITRASLAILAKNLQAVVKVLECEAFFKHETIWSSMSLPQPFFNGVIVVSL